VKTAIKVMSATRRREVVFIYDKLVCFKHDITGRSDGIWPVRSDWMWRE
jgi:hypothetical protein